MLLNEGYWRRHFAGAASAIGQTLIVNAQPHEIIGVMPKGFRIVNAEADVILPYRFDRNTVRLGQFNYQGIARHKPGVTLEYANADVARMIPIWLKSWPMPPGIELKVFENARFTPAIRPLKQDVIGDLGNVLWILMGTIGIVLLVACANVANLLLVRVDGRQRELALRVALGARWSRIAREVLLESLVLGVVGGALGLGLASAGLQLLVAIGPATLPRLDEIAIDVRVLSFTVITSLVTGLVFGLVPVARYAVPRIAGALNGGGRTVTQSRERNRARDALIVAQVGLCLMLLAGSGLMIRTALALRNVDAGFQRPEHVQLVRLSVPSDVKDPDQVLRMQHAISDRLAAIPGVSQAAFASGAPMEGDGTHDILLTEGHAYEKGQLPPIRRFEFISPRFFETTGTPLLAGRDITWSDVYDHRPVALISENIARELWREPSLAVGKRIREMPNAPWREVIGVVGDVHYEGVHQKAPPVVYWPTLMKDFHEATTLQRTVTFTIRSSRAGMDNFATEIREAVRGANPNIPLAQVRTLEDHYERSLARTSFTLIMMSIAAALALLLGIVGIYGVISYAVTQRTKEIGIRSALGAQQTELKRMFVGYGLMLTGVGVIAGLAGAAALAPLMGSMLFGVGPFDPVTYAAVSAVLVIAASAASYVPARRAARVNPLVALRYE